VLESGTNFILGIAKDIERLHKNEHTLTLNSRSNLDNIQFDHSSEVKINSVGNRHYQKEMDQIKKEMSFNKENLSSTETVKGNKEKETSVRKMSSTLSGLINNLPEPTEKHEKFNKFRTYSQ